MIDCHEADRLMDDRLDGELGAAAAARLDEHLAACAGCREAFGRLRAVVDGAGALPPEAAPGRDLWPGIARRIAAGRVAPFRRPARPPAAWGLLAAAAAVLVAATAVITTAVVGRGGAERAAATGTVSAARLAVAPDDPMASGLEEYRRAAASLRAVVEQRRQQLSPDTRAVVDDNLRVIGDAIGRIEAALAKQPRNRELRTLLVATYQQEIEVLRTATEIPRRG